jgi:hypothetical protein
MAIQYVHAKPGYIFRLTYVGKLDGRIAAKYDPSYPNEQYKTCVPKRWLTEGLVEEVKEETT